MEKKEQIKQLRNAINRTKNNLVKKAKERGIYENFGEREIRRLEDKYIDISDYTEEGKEIKRIMDEFKEWARNYCG